MDNSTTPSEEPQIEWRDVPGYVGWYQVSDDGQVKRIKRAPGTSRAVLKPAINHKQYRVVRLCMNGIEHDFTIHYLVMLAFVGERPEGMQINHRNGDKGDNRSANLEYVSGRENMLHSYAYLDRQSAHGERNGMAKLTDEKVREIRLKFASGKFKKSELAEMYGVSRYVIYGITTGKLWMHIP